MSINICIVIPCYRVSRQILNVINRIDIPDSTIVIVDDACPEGTGRLVEQKSKKKNLKVITSKTNLGVGGAVKLGFNFALENNAKVVVKLDGDGQAPPENIQKLISKILDGNSDYVTGNRFENVEKLITMPKVRLFGNIMLSFLAKCSTGYWKIFDPNNGFIAIKGDVLHRLPLTKIDNGYFFESDMLFRLNLLEARVAQIPIDAYYGDETSSLNINKAIFEFSYKHFRNFLKRISYWYFVKDFNLASINLLLGSMLTLTSLIVGVDSWLGGKSSGAGSRDGTIALVAIGFLVGIQLLINFINFDAKRTL